MVNHRAFEFGRFSTLMLTQLRGWEKLVQPSRDLGVSARTNGILKHPSHETISGLATLTRRVIDGGEQVIGNSDCGLPERHDDSNPSPGVWHS
jgi:hypothetical protein